MAFRVKLLAASDLIRQPQVWILSILRSENSKNENRFIVIVVLVAWGEPSRRHRSCGFQGMYSVMPSGVHSVALPSAFGLKHFFRLENPCFMHTSLFM